MKLIYGNYIGIIKNIEEIWYIENIEPCSFCSVKSSDVGIAMEYWKQEVDYRRKIKFQ